MKTSDLKISQPVFYTVIEKAFQENKVPHAYLLCAKKGIDLHQVAMYLCKCFICEEELLACDECNDCKRIDENRYVDFIRYDGKEESIKKRHIENIQSQFKKASVEGKARVYLLENIDYATPESMNSLLKMLEEPTPGIYAVLTCENKNRVLPTIQSRCQNIHFKAISQDVLVKALIDDGMKEEDAKILSYIYDSTNVIKEIENSDKYRNLKLECVNFVEDYYTKKENLLINCQTHVFKNYNNREDIQFFLDLLFILFKDVLYASYQLPIAYQSYLDQIKSYDCNQEVVIEILELILKTKEAIKNNANLMLLMDSFVYEIQRR